MKRKEVYDAIDSERNYQENQKKDDKSHVVEDFPLSSALEAIRYNIEKANQSWYTEKNPYPNAMEYMRKIAAICIQMGEKYDMPRRVSGSSESDSIVYECVGGRKICPEGNGVVVCGKCFGLGCK